MRNLLIRTAFAAVAFSAVAAQAAAPAMTAETAKGPALVDAKEHDPLHLRQGHGRQVDVQRPLRRQLAGPDGGLRIAASGDWTTVTRDDGTMQWAYKGKPLYIHLRQGHQAGDTTGDGFLNGAWHIAKP